MHKPFTKPWFIWQLRRSWKLIKAILGWSAYHGGFQLAKLMRGSANHLEILLLNYDQPTLTFTRVSDTEQHRLSITNNGTTPEPAGSKQ